MNEAMYEHARRLALQDAERTWPATLAMRGIDLEGLGPRLSAHPALIAAFLVSRGEPRPKPFGLVAVAAVAKGGH